MSNCSLGDIVQPGKNTTFYADQYPLSIPIEIASITPLNDFLSQISLNSDFTTDDGYIFSEDFENPKIVVYMPGVYYIRLSCDGTTWTPVVSFTVVTVPASDICPINNFTMELNNEQTGFDIKIPQMLYGAPILSMSVSSLHFARGLEINISDKTNFVRNIYRFYNYSNKVGPMYKTTCIIPTLNLKSTYHARVRLLLNNVWGPYSTVGVSWSDD